MSKTPKRIRQQFRALLRIHKDKNHYTSRQIRLILRAMGARGKPHPLHNGQRYYILQGRHTFPVRLLHWALWFEHCRARVLKQTPLPGGVIVSTVFIGLDQSFGMSAEPVLFETMTFGGGQSLFQQRHRTYDDAIKGHERAVNEAPRLEG